MILDLSYRDKLLKLSKLYKIKEVQRKLSNSRLTNKQIESFLKKNNVLLPQKTHQTYYFLKY